MNITIVTPSNTRFEERIRWRCTSPAEAINRTGRHKANILSAHDFLNPTGIACSICEESDVIYIYRDLFGEMLIAIEHWKSKGKIVAGDMDYACQLLEPTQPEYHYWYPEPPKHKGSNGQTATAPVVQLKWGVQLVDLLTLASRRLVDDWQSYTRAEFLPHFIDYEKYPALPKSSQGECIIGWKGSRVDVHGLIHSGALEAITEVVRLRPHVRLLVCSDSPDVIKDLPLPAGNMTYEPYSVHDWPQVLSRIHIGIAPLEGELDQRKGPADVLEFLVTKTPWIASAGAAYRDLAGYGWLVKNQSTAWLRVLLDMVDHYPDYRSEAEREPYLYGISQGIDENIQYYLNLFVQAASRVNRSTAKKSSTGNMPVSRGSRGDET